MNVKREIQHQIMRGYGINPIYTDLTVQHITDMLSDKATTVEQLQSYMRAEFNSHPAETANWVAKLIINSAR